MSTDSLLYYKHIRDIIHLDSDKNNETNLVFLIEWNMHPSFLRFCYHKSLTLLTNFHTARIQWSVRSTFSEFWQNFLCCSDLHTQLHSRFILKKIERKCTKNWVFYDIFAARGKTLVNCSAKSERMNRAAHERTNELFYEWKCFWFLLFMLILFLLARSSLCSLFDFDLFHSFSSFLFFSRVLRR